MPASTSTAFPDNSTDANFRAWATLISNAIAAAGWVQTADTGQINLATVSKPASSTASQGFQVWRTADAGKQQWFVKFEYGSSSSGATIPAIWVTLGTGSNGSGTLTGQLSTRTTLMAGAANAATQFDCRFSGTTSRFTMVMWSQQASSSNHAIVLNIERTLDGSGAETDIGMNVMGYASATNYSQFAPKTGAVPAATAFIPWIRPADASRTVGSDIGFIGLHPSSLLTQYPACRGLMAFYATDFADGTSQTVPRWGVNRPYLTCRLRNTTPSFGDSTPGTFAAAMLYE